MRRLWSVGWAPLSVVFLHVGLTAAIGHQRELDPAFHFAGGAAGAYCLLQLVRLFRPRTGPLSRQRPVLIVLAIMVAVTVVWEVMEFASDQLLGTHVQLGSSDTGMDILLGMLGALSVLVAAGLRSGQGRLSEHGAG